MSGNTSRERSKKFIDHIKRPHDEIVKSCVRAREGVIVKGTGDGFLIVFQDPEDALWSAMTIQERVKSAAIVTPRGPLQIRIGLCTGYGKREGKDYVGDAVNKAQRVQSLCLPGQVCISSETHGLVEGKLPGLSFDDLGLKEMAGFGNQRFFAAQTVHEDGYHSTSITQEVTQDNQELSSDLNLSDNTSTRKPVVIIGDPDEERFKWLKKVLAEVYLTDALHAKTLEEVKQLARDLSVKVSFRVVFLADSLPLSVNFGKADPRINFSKLEELEEFYESDFCCLLTSKQKLHLDGLQRQPQIVRAPSLTAKNLNEKAERDRILSELSGLRRIRAIQIQPIEDLKNITFWDESNTTLRQQIRSLSDSHDLDDGLKQLLHLFRASLAGDGLTRLQLTSMGQGLSGTQMFGVAVTSEEGTKQHVLKLRDSSQKLESEVRVYNQRPRTLNTGLPILRTPVSPLDPSHEEQKFIVQYGRWWSIHYDFPSGNKSDRFIDLETALIGAPLKLKETTRGTDHEFSGNSSDELLQYRLKVFQSVLDGLCKFSRGKNVINSRKLEIIWKIENASEEAPAILPPYQLTRFAKRKIEDFLDSRAAIIGARLLPNWEEHLRNALILVSNRSTIADLGRLGESIPFILSPVHGDLNSSNILLDHGRNPLIIDWAFYQKMGHCLQDFARLEVEIKLALLDRQQESPIDPLAAYDYTVSQLPLWLELEDQLLVEQAFVGSRLKTSLGPFKWNSTGYAVNVDLCYRLVMMLRQKAYEIQQKKLARQPKPVSFAQEYLPALLYHSVLAIGCPSLSVFKRLLAVHSAGSIFSRLR
jgi:hypothetical protein